MAALYGFPRSDHAYTATEVGHALGGLIIHDLDGKLKEGVLRDRDIVQKVGVWTLGVMPFTYIWAEHNAPVFGGIDAYTQVNIAGAPSSGTRIDVIAYDKNAVPPTILDPSATGTALPDEDPDGDATTELPVVDSTASGIVYLQGKPGKPALSDGLVELAYIDVPAEATSVDDVRIHNSSQLTNIIGSELSFRDAASFKAFKPQVGQKAYRTDLGGDFDCLTAGKWRQTSGRIGPIKIPKWKYSANGISAYTGVFTIPTNISSFEHIEVFVHDAGTGFCFAQTRHVDLRGADSTKVAVGIYQVGSAVLQTVELGWRITKRTPNWK